MTKVVALVPAYNEAATIGKTLYTLISQTHPVTIVVLPNGCTDNTAEIARTFPVTVMEFGRLEHKKSQAMNYGWIEHCQDADLVITVDADTELEPESVQQWVDEFAADPKLAGSCARFTMRAMPPFVASSPELIGRDLLRERAVHQNSSFLTRLQRMDFSMGIDISLRRGWTCVLAGAASCFRNDVLKAVYALDDREGPWTYVSAVEDFEVTYRARTLGYGAHVSPVVRAYTDAMKTWKALKGQRMKWQMGTIEDLISFGLNRYTRVMWGQQLLGWASVLILLTFFAIMTYTIGWGTFNYSGWTAWVFSIGIPVLVWMKNLKHASRIPHRDWVDMALAASIVVYEVFSWRRIGWFVQAWCSVLWEKATHNRKDRWAMQDAAESGNSGRQGRGGKHRISSKKPLAPVG